MTDKKLRYAMAAVLIQIFLHLYLTFHYYQLKFAGAIGQSFCNINTYLNCDAVSASAYSALLGIPLALWGALTNLLLLVILVGIYFGLSTDNERSRRHAFWISAFIATTSVVMGVISATMINYLCILCVAAYAFSFIAALTLFLSAPRPLLPSLPQDLKIWLGVRYLAFYVSVPALAWLTHVSLLSSYGVERLGQRINTSIADWRSEPAVVYDTPPLLSQGAAPETAKMTVREFADFTCPACQMTAGPLELFAKSRPQVRFEFYAFPLDGDCNSEVPKRNGTPCRLAKAVYCANQSQRGWEMHERLFARENSVPRSAPVNETDVMIKRLTLDLGLDWGDFLKCLDSAAAQTAIEDQAKMGKKAGVEGTPMISVDGRPLSVPVVYLRPVLEKLFSDAVRP